MTDFHVLVSDTPFNSTALNTTINQSGVGDFHFPGTAGRETDINLNRNGRYLRIQLSGSNALQLAEVEIMACVSEQAIIYQNCGFNGSSVSLGIGNYPNIANAGFANDSLSSLRVPAGLQVTLYENNAFGGASITFTADDFCLINNSFNDACSSLKIEAIGGNRRAFSSRLMLIPYFGQKTNLEWHVSQNEDKVISQYIIKHGTDEYEELNELTIIPATETLGIESYRYRHETPSAGKNFYQVVVEYEDGSVDYPMYGDITFDEAPNPITIAPNPARNSIKVDLTNYMDKSIHYTIYSIQGSQMLEGQYEANHNYIEELNLEQIPNGVYILYLQADNSRAIAIKFVVNKDN